MADTAGTHLPSIDARSFVAGRAARCSTERQRRGTGTGCERLSGRALTQPAVLAMIKRAVRGEAGDVDLPLGNRHSDPDPGEEEAAEAARLSDARHGVGATGDR